ncbi:MAG: sigma-70 family RNA polymerase sigma factor [Eubacterium sp.]|nr:sigma-70 family RNA polymerase sigma factor [Eubacterium sp.]
MKQTNVAEFVEENLKTIFAYALSRVSDCDDAEDLTNDIVLAILQSADKIKDPNAFYGYIWGIASNTYKKFLRKKNRHAFETLDENFSDETDFTDDLLLREDIMALRRETALLSKEYRECTIAYYYDGLSCAEVSKKLKISPEMVKYYLFKTRKILKEGISMEREFGEKSFRPEPFEFVTIYTGIANSEYGNLFTRKLPGQILLSAYYTSMSVRELAIELGVASVYLEDELTLLEKYNLITKLPSGKYQTKLVIFTDVFTEEFYRSAEKTAMSALGDIISGISGKLDEIRKINFVCEKLSDRRLLWGLLFVIMLWGNREFTQRYPQYEADNKIYGEARGINYGVSNYGSQTEFACGVFAGYAGIDENYYATAADFGILPERNRFFANTDMEEFAQKIYDALSGKCEPEFIILSKAEEQHLFELFKDEIGLMAGLYDKLFAYACEAMRAHAPKRISEQIERIVFKTLCFQTVGFIGGCAVKSGALAIPDFNGPAAVCVRENTKTAKAIVNRNIQI